MYPHGKSGRRSGSFLFIGRKSSSLILASFSFVEEENRMDQGGVFPETRGSNPEIPPQGSQDRSNWHPGSSQMGNRRRLTEKHFPAYSQYSGVHQDGWE